MNRSAGSRTAPHPLVRFLKTPKGHVLAALLFLTLLAGAFPQGPAGLVNALAAVLTALALDTGVALALRRKIVFSDGGVITGLIVADVLSGLTPLYIVVLTTAVALLSKHVLKRGRKPLFNPAAFGLLFALVVFSTGQSWWASLALLPIWYLPALLAVGIFVAIRVKKYPQVLAFLGAYFGLLLAMAVWHLGLPSDTPGDALRVPFVNSALFMAFFMLTDPPTTPSSNSAQVLFGVIVAGVSVVLFALYGGLAYLLIGLLAGNAWKMATSWVRKPARRPLPSPAVSLKNGS